MAELICSAFSAFIKKNRPRLLVVYFVLSVTLISQQVILA